MKSLERKNIVHNEKFKNEEFENEYQLIEMQLRMRPRFERKDLRIKSLESKN